MLRSLGEPYQWYAETYHSAISWFQKHAQRMRGSVLNSIQSPQSPINVGLMTLLILVARSESVMVNRLVSAEIARTSSTDRARQIRWQPQSTGARPGLNNLCIPHAENTAGDQRRNCA